MQEIKLLFLSLKDKLLLRFNPQDDINTYTVFLGDLFIPFNHDMEVQSNNEKIRLSINNLVSKYKSIFPQVHQLNTFLKNLAEGEKFFLFGLSRNLTQEEEVKLGIELVNLNMPSLTTEEIEKYRKFFHFFELVAKPLLNFYQVTTTNVTKKIHIGESNKDKRVCRFCGRTKITGASFQNKAHAISEALGNKTIILNEECDECNSYFDQNIERDFITYLSPFRILFGILNKDNKIPSIKGKNATLERFGDHIQLNTISGKEKDKINPIELLENFPLKLHESLVQQNIYKTLVKYALSIPDKINLKFFSETIKWIREPTNFKEKLPKIGVLGSYKFFHTQPKMFVYIQKNDNDNNPSFPYAVGILHFTFLTYIFIIPTFSNLEADFTIEAEFSRFWQFFKHYGMTKEFQFEDFSNSEKRNVQFNFSFKEILKQLFWDK